MSTLTDARNQTSTLKYDGAGQLLEISGAVMGGAAYKQTYTYNDAGDLIRSTDPAGRATDYSYDASGQGAWTRRTDAAGSVTERSYDEHGLLTAETVYTVADPDGAAGPQAPSGARTTRYIYDTASGHRRLAYLLGPQGEVTRYTYDSAGQLSRQDVFTADRYSGQPHQPCEGRQPLRRPVRVRRHGQPAAGGQHLLGRRGGPAGPADLLVRLRRAEPLPRERRVLQQHQHHQQHQDQRRLRQVTRRNAPAGACERTSR